MPHGAHRGGFLDRSYVGLLTWALNHRWAMILIAIATLSSTFVVYRYIGRDWMPQEDQNELSINLELPAGTSINELERVTREMAARVAKVDGVVRIIPSAGGRMGMGGSSSSNTTVLLKSVSERGPILGMGQKVRDVLRPYAYARPPDLVP